MGLSGNAANKGTMSIEIWRPWRPWKQVGGKSDVTIMGGYDNVQSNNNDVEGSPFVQGFLSPLLFSVSIKGYIDYENRILNLYIIVYKFAQVKLLLCEN